ncbi:MAG: hypothetical protein R3A13_12105 [Bdellovibrionota bacterium]
MSKKILFSLFIFISFIGIFAVPAFAKDCKACPYNCATERLDKSVCKDFKNKKGKCCIERTDGKLGAGTHCGTERRCTDTERKNRGCKDFKNKKGKSCISFES